MDRAKITTFAPLENCIPLVGVILTLLAINCDTYICLPLDKVLNSDQKTTTTPKIQSTTTTLTTQLQTRISQTSANNEETIANKTNATRKMEFRINSNANNNEDDNNNNGDNDDDGTALEYLKRFGYLNASTSASSNSLISEDSFSSAIKSFQKFANAPQTGILDKTTMTLMKAPRCGNKDSFSNTMPQKSINRLLLKSIPTLFTSSNSNENNNNNNNGINIRRRRYALQGSKWRRHELSYRISQYPTRFANKKHEVDSQIEKAFGIWSQVAPIDFVVRREGRVHIDIRFASGDHGDGDSFDGPGNTLAHAYFPQYGGDAHFDDQEYWTIDSFVGTNIFQVAAHELGHSLGLGHSSVREALMTPFYQKYKPNFKLHADDILAIQALYGEKPITGDDDSDGGGDGNSIGVLHPSAATPTTLATPTINDTQSNERPPTRLKPGVALFPPPQMPSATHKPVPLFPRLPTLRPTSVDGFEDRMPANPTRPSSNDDEMTSSGNNGGDNSIAADTNPFLRRDGSGTEFDGESPSFDTNDNDNAKILNLCLDSNIDAATKTEDGNSYVFKGDFFWLLTRDGVARNYPRKIADYWDGLPGNLDAALTWADGKTFFFKGNKYWRFRNKRRDIGYPKLISAGFAGIPNDIDAAIVWGGNGGTYIFKGGEYWRFDSKSDPPVARDYPRSIKVWSGVPTHISAALRWDNNVTYFFKGNHYYRFNDKEFRVETRGRPPFPRRSAEWWFGCGNNENSHFSRLPTWRPFGTLLSRRTQASSQATQVDALRRSSDKESKLGHPQQQRQQQQQQQASVEEWQTLTQTDNVDITIRGTHVNDAPATSIERFNNDAAATIETHSHSNNNDEHDKINEDNNHQPSTREIEGQAITPRRMREFASPSSSSSSSSNSRLTNSLPLLYSVLSSLILLLFLLMIDFKFKLKPLN